MTSELKRTLCNELIDKGLVEENDVIRHSYTRNRLDNGVGNMARTESKEKLSPTLDTRCDCLGVVVKESSTLQKEVCNQAIEKGLLKPFDIIDYTYSNARLDEMANGHIRTMNSENNHISNTLTTRSSNFGICVPNNFLTVDDESVIVREATKKGYAVAVEGDSINLGVPNSQTRRGRVGKGVSNTLTTSPQIATVEPSLRIRKLTPKECWRLMGFDDEDFTKAEKVNTNSQLYKQAGNSIVVNVLMAIFKELFVPKKSISNWLDDLLN